MGLQRGFKHGGPNPPRTTRRERGNDFVLRADEKLAAFVEPNQRFGRQIAPDKKDSGAPNHSLVVTSR